MIWFSIRERSAGHVRAIFENVMSRYINSLVSGCTKGWPVVEWDFDSAGVSVDNCDFIDSELGPDCGVDSSEEFRFQLNLFRDGEGLCEISEEADFDLETDGRFGLSSTAPELTMLDVEPREPIGSSGGRRKYSRTDTGLFSCGSGLGSKHSTGYSRFFPDSFPLTVEKERV